MLNLANPTETFKEREECRSKFLKEEQIMRHRLIVYLLATTLFLVGSIYTDLTYGQTVTCNIPPGGGTCDLPGFASVTFPPGAFVTPAAFVPVTVSVTAFPETDEEFGETGGDLRLPYEIRDLSEAA